MNFCKKLFLETKETISTFDETDAYAILFFVYSNEAFTYKNHENISEFYIGICKNIDVQYEDERWEFSTLNRHSKQVLPSDECSYEMLFDWYKKRGVENVGEEPFPPKKYGAREQAGFFPNGYYELLCLISNIGRQLQQEGFIENKFGKRIPIIVRELDVGWETREATENANPGYDLVKILDENR